MQPPPNKEVVRWGVLGAARIAIHHVIPALQQVASAELVAIASRDLDKAKDAAAHFGIPKAFSSYEELLDDPDVDAVYIPLPNSLHAPWTIRAAEAGVHVLCEKPLALDATEAGEMIAACRQRNVQLAEAFMYRYHPQIVQTLELVRSGEIGAPRIIRGNFSFELNRPDDVRWDPALGGGALLDVGCYPVNAARLVFGAEPVTALAAATFTKGGVDETLAGVLTFPDERYALVDCSFRLPFRQGLEIVGTAGRIALAWPYNPGLKPATLTVTRGEDERTITIPSANNYILMIEAFDDALLSRRPLAYPPEDAQANMRVLDMLAASARQAVEGKA
jgi:predicted dehydrogenase